MTRSGSTCAWDERLNRSGELGAQAPETSPAKCYAKSPVLLIIPKYALLLFISSFSGRPHRACSEEHFH